MSRDSSLRDALRHSAELHTAEDLLAEARRIIPIYCPEWTDLNPTDPGVMLLELFAWMTEGVLYRLDRLPERLVDAVLDRLALRRMRPAPDRAIAVVRCRPGAGATRIPAGTALVMEAGEAGRVQFETDADVWTAPVEAVRAFSVGQALDGTAALVEHTARIGRGSPAALWPQCVTAPVRVEWEHPLFEQVAAGGVLALRGEVVVASGAQAHRLDLAPAFDWCIETDGGSVALEYDADTQSLRAAPGAVGTLLEPNAGVARTWRLVGRVARGELPGGELRVVGASAQVARASSVCVAERVSVDDEGRIVQAATEGAPWAPFGRQPQPGASAWLALEGQCPRLPATVVLHLEEAQPAAMMDSSTRVAWECWDGRRWQEVAARAVEGGPAALALAARGVVALRLDGAWPEATLAGRRGRWIRCRLVQGGFGEPRGVERNGEGGAPQWREPAGRAPRLSSVEAHWTGAPVDLPDVAVTAAAGAAPVAAFYVGFDGECLPPELSLYVELADSPAGGSGRCGALAAEQLDDPVPAVPRGCWEWAVGRGQWEPGRTEDATRGLSRSGIVRLVPPEGVARVAMQGTEAWWVRWRASGAPSVHGEPTGEASWVTRAAGGSPDACSTVVPRRLAGLWTHCVPATEGRTLRGVVLGSSDGLPGLRLPLPRGPLGPPIEVAVCEEEGAPPRPWTCVASLDASGADDRHVTVDFERGEVRFGDGVHGRIPPRGRDNVLLVRARRSAGDTPPLRAGLSLRLDPEHPAVAEAVVVADTPGGRPAESAAAARSRLLAWLRGGGRAVTAEDYRALAHGAGSWVGRVDVLVAWPREGSVGLVVARRASGPPGGPRSDRPEAVVPSAEELVAVERTVRSAMPAGVELRVLPARPVPCDVTVHVRCAPDVAPAVRAGVAARVREAFAPERLPERPAPTVLPMPSSERLAATLEAVPGVVRVDGVHVDVPAFVPPGALAAPRRIEVVCEEVGDGR